MSSLRFKSGVKIRPVSCEIVKVISLVTSVPSAVLRVPPVGNPVTVTVKESPSESVGVEILSAMLLESSSMETVVVPTTVGAELGLGAMSWPPPPPPPPQAERVKEASAGKVRFSLFSF